MLFYFFLDLVVVSCGSLCGSLQGLELRLITYDELAEHHGSCYFWNVCSKKKCERFIAGVVNRLLLMLAGDVEENPGPFGTCLQECY